MSRWKREPGIFDAGDIGGDVQITDAHSVRLRLRDDRRSMITISVYGAHQDPNRETPDGEYQLLEQVEMIVGTDPEDVGGTEVWSDYRYTVVASGQSASGLDYAAHCYASELAAYPELEELIAWDGGACWRGDVDPLLEERLDAYDRADRKLG